MRASVCLVDSGAAPAHTCDITFPAVDLTGPWSAHPGDGELAKQFADREFDDRAWTDRPSPPSLAHRRRVRGGRRSGAVPAPAHRARRPPRSPRIRRARRHLLLRRRLVRRRLPRHHRGLLRPARVRGHRCAARRERTRARARGRRARRNATAPPSGRSPACSGTGTRPIPRSTPAAVASDPHRRDRTRSASRLARAVHRSARGTRPPDLRRHARRRRRPARCRPARGGVRPDRRECCSTRTDRSRSRRARTGSRGCSASTPRRAGGRRRSATSRCARCDIAVEIGDGAATNARCAPRSARSAATTGSSPSTASGCSSRAPTSRRRAWRSATRRADEIRRDLVLAQDANLDLVRVHAHVARPELYDAADELGLLVWQDLPLQWGYARSVRTPGGPPGARDGRPARPPPERHAVVRAQRAVRVGP